jgi:hypothetical protein
MKESGTRKRMFEMAKDNKFGQMGRSMKAIGSMTRQTEGED